MFVGAIQRLVRKIRHDNGYDQGRRQHEEQQFAANREMGFHSKGIDYTTSPETGKKKISLRRRGSKAGPRQAKPGFLGGAAELLLGSLFNLQGPDKVFQRDNSRGTGDSGQVLISENNHPARRIQAEV